jgi:hypothetical protein
MGGPNSSGLPYNLPGKAVHSHTHIHIPNSHHRNPYRNIDYRIHCNHCIHHYIERRNYFLKPTKTQRCLKLIFFSFLTPNKL